MTVIPRRRTSSTDAAPTSRRASAATIVVQVHARGQPDRGRGQRVVDRQATERGDRDVGRPPGVRASWKRIPAVPADVDVDRPNVGVVGEAVADGPRDGSRVHPGDDRVVGVEDRPAARRQRLEQLALGLLDRVERADPREVDRLHRGDDADRRPGHRREVGDLAADVHAHLEDRCLVLRAEAQERQRQPDLVVLVALVLERPARRAEDRRDRLLGRGLGDAAGDPDDQRIEAPAPAGAPRRRARPARPRRGRS